MPPKAKEIDALKQEVLRKHLDTLKQIAPPEQSTGAFTLDRGYLNENNEATPLGNQYLLLLDNGLMDENGELTEEGRIYSKTQKEAVYGSPDDYIKREKLGLNQLDKDATKVGFGDSMLSMGKQFVTESIPAMFRFMSPTASLDPLQQINDASTLVKSSWLSLEPLATGAVSKIADASLALQNEDADIKETASLLLKQEYEKKRYDYDSITGADFLTALSGGSTVPNQMRDILIKQKGEEYVTGQEQAVGLVGSFVDPSVIASMGATVVAKAAGKTMMRSLLHAEKQALKFSILSTEQAGIRSQMAALGSALSRAEGVGAKVTEKASALESIGKTAESVRYKATAARIGDSMQDIKGKLDELVAADSKISTDLAGLSKKAGIGDALIGINNKIQQFNALPANAIGQTVETIGNGLMKADAWLDDIATRTGIDGVYNTLKSIPGLSAGLVLGPAAAVPTIGARILASGPFLESVGKYTKILGKELMQARGSSSYWQRVANNPTISNAQRFLSHRMDELTLGGYLPEVAGSVAKGTAASYPMNLAIEYLQDPYGETEDILNRAAGVSLVFGGGFSGVTQMFKGSKETLKAVRIGDELNFTRNLLESQKAGYNSLGKGSRRMVSSFAAAFPNLNWDFVDGLPSRYDPVTNTVRINPKSNNPLRPLIAHEVGHYISIRNGANPLIHSMLLGDAETPGILRKTNGELDPEFQRFKDEYDKRTDAGNIERRSIEDIAEEYFIENTVDHMVEMVESGELSKMTGRTQAGRQLRKFIQATMPRVPILKDFFFRSGGAMQAGGKFVEGNGLLAEGLRELPEAKAMMRNLIRDTAGEASSVPRGKGEKGDAGNRFPVQKGDPIIDSFHSILESDANGQPLLDKDGDHIPLSRATDEARQAAGLVLIEEQIRRVNDGYMPEDGEIKLIPDKGWQGRFISPGTINALAAKGILNAKQIAILRNINTATRQNSGTRYMVINHPATIKRRGGKIRYASLEAALRETVPVGFSITKTGNVLVHLMSVDQLHKNVTSRAASKRGQALYQGNPEAIKQDISAMMDMHATNTKTDKYYQDKYGPKWEEHQRFINTIFGQMTKEQRNINPMFDADKIKDGNVYRTFRLDRISKATKMDGTPIPFNYDYVKVNYFPDGVVDKSEQMPEQMRYMPEVAVVPERFTGSATDIDRRGKYAEPPGFFKKFNIDSYERGGRFFDAQSGEDLTGKQYSTGSIDVSTGKPRLFVDNISESTPTGNKFKTNLFKQKAGWKWTSENPPPTSTIVSVEGQGKHIYTLKANFESGVELVRYSEKPSEPRLRPTAYGELKLGEKVGEISIRGKAHPVYDSVGIIPKVKEQTRQMPEEPITSSSEKWKSMSNEEKDAYVFTPAEMTPSNRAEFDARVESGSLPADTPVVNINRSNLLTSRYGPPSSSATGNINTWIDDNTGKPVAVAFSENGNIPTKGERSQTPRYMPEKRQEIGDDMVVDRGDKDTLDVTQAVDKKGKPMWKADKPVLVSVGYNLATAPNLDKFAGNAENPSTDFLDNIPYNLNGAEKSRVEALIKNGVVDRLANDMAENTRTVLKDPAIAAGKGWYSRMREKLLKALGESGRELFSQFLGATSAQTPVDENFLQTVDAYEGMMSGRYNRHRKGYLTAIRTESKGKLNEEIVKSRAVEKTEELISKLKSALPSAKKAERIPIYAEIKSLTELIEKPVKERTSAQRLRLYVVGNDLLPRRSNGAKFNANSGAVLKVIAGVWLNNRESPKTPNFAGNLSGRTTQATIDIWAARYIRRMIYGGEGTPWRIQPKSEVGVSNEDFAFSQVIMQRAAEKLKMNPDDLQAILWFAEKDVWDKNKWTKNEGAKKSSFDDIFDVFFPEGRKPLTFAEGFAVMKAKKAKEKSIAEEKKKSIIKAEADSLGISIAALNKMKSKNKSK